MVDRSKDVILCGSENVYSVEVENALLRHPTVSQAAVFGTPSDLMGELVEAAVVARLGYGSLGAQEDELFKVCREVLSDYKVPTSIHLVPKLPTNATGKVLKRELSAHFAASRKVSQALSSACESGDFASGAQCILHYPSGRMRSPRDLALAMESVPPNADLGVVLMPLIKNELDECLGIG